MNKEIKLTKKQENVLNFIKKYIAKYNYPPSIREICDGINLKSPATVFVHLNNLENKGIIKTANGKFRTIKLLVDNEFVKKDEYKSKIDEAIRYINNLQEELEATQELAVNYKLRIDKAIEYIKEDIYVEPKELYGLVDGEHLLNILKGGDEE